MIFSQRLSVSRLDFAVTFRVAVLVVVVSRIRLFLRSIQHHTEQTLARNLFEQFVDDAVTRLAGANDQHRTVSAVHQYVRVRKDAERRRVDDDVVKQAPRFHEHALISWAGKKFGHVIAWLSAGQQIKTGRVETNDGVFESNLSAENFGKSDGGVDAEVVGRAGPAEIAVDHQRANPIGLRQQPAEIQRRQGLAFGDARAGDDESTHLHAFTRLQDAGAQGAKLFAVSRTRLANRNEMWFDAR